MVFFWLLCIIPLLVLMMARVRNRGEEEGDELGPNSSDPMYDEEEGFEEEGDEDELEGDTEGQDEKGPSNPLWNYVTKLDGGKGGGSYKFVCPHGCHGGKPYTGSYTRLRRHLCGVLDSDERKGSVGVSICPNISTEERRKYIQIEMAAQQKNKKQKTHSESSATSKFGSCSPSPHGTSATSGGRKTIGDFLNVAGRDDVDGKIVRFLCACGVPFNVLRSPYWHEMVKAINEAPKGYKAPNYEKARTVLLEREKSKVQRALTRFTHEWVDFGVSIVSDGWTNIRNQHLINVLGVSSSGAVFIACHDSSSISATAQNIADLLLKSIKDVGPNNVVQVITDNAANCKAAGKIIERTHPHIFWSGCLVHTLNLLMHDIVKHKDCGWIAEVYRKGKQVIKFITGHTRVNYFYGTYSKLQLLKIAKTRFASYYLTFRRLVRVRQALTNLVCAETWDEINTDTDGANDVKDTVLDSYFWSQVKYVLQFTKPIYYMIKFADSDRPVIGEVYEQMDSMLGQIKDIVEPRDTTLYNYIRVEVQNRWEMLNIPLHALAYVLTPKYYHPSWLSKPAPGGGSRRKPHQDREVHEKYMAALSRLIPDDEEAALVRRQVSNYTLNTGPFGSMHAIQDRENFSALEWWNMHGGGTPLLQSLALRVLSQVVNTSSAERCWSSYSFIHSVKRNRLSLDRAESLVYVHYNLRLLSHYCEDAKSNKDLLIWDKNPEEPNLEDGVLRLEQLEDALIQDDDDRVDMPPPPSGPLVPTPRFHGSTPTTGGSSSSVSVPRLPDAPSSSLPPRGGPPPRSIRAGRRRD